MSDHSSPSESPKGSIYRRGNMAAIALAVITIVEFILAAYTSSAVVMLLLGILKAGIIMNIFMGISRLWNEEDHH